MYKVESYIDNDGNEKWEVTYNGESIAYDLHKMQAIRVHSDLMGWR